MLKFRCRLAPEFASEIRYDKNRADDAVRHIAHVRLITVISLCLLALILCNNCCNTFNNKPRGASPRRNYVRSEEDGISTNRII